MAGVTGDIITLLDKIPIWKRVQETPARIDALEQRIAELEKRLERAPGDACPKCGLPAMRLDQAGNRRGERGQEVRYDKWKCQDCGFEDERVVRF